MITKREMAVISAYTGVLLGEFSEMCKYVEQIMKRPVWTHEYADEDVVNEIKQKSKKDFCGLVGNDTPADPQHGREPDKVKPLAQYVGEYIEHEFENDNMGMLMGDSNAYNSWRELLEQALDAYESTEQVKIRIEKI